MNTALYQIPSKSKLLATFLFCLCSGIASAENRALIIGVGKYADSSANLAGIDLDVDVMVRVARTFGFANSQIKVIQDKDATLESVDRAMSTWLVNGVNEDDHVLVYYSGHGTQVVDKDGDEPVDGADEALLMHDVAVRDGDIVSGALIDDRFSELLSGIPSRQVIVIVDACHSGTGFKSLFGRVSGAEGGSVKSFEYAGMPGGRVPHGNKGIAFVPDESVNNFAALMAAADDEESIATELGSIFTMAIGLAVDEAVESGDVTTLQQLHESAIQFVQTELASFPEKLFTPQLGGAAHLAQLPLRIVNDDSRRNSLQNWVERFPGVTLAASKPSFRVGDSDLKITVTVPHDGFLNIVIINPDDKAVVLFPNQFNKNNYVSTGDITLPTPEMNFDFRASEPVGRSTFVAVLSAKPLNLYDSGLGARDSSGELTAVFTGLSAAGTSDIESVAGQGVFKAGRVLIEVTN